MKRAKFKNSEVAAVFDGYPSSARDKLLDLRQLIFNVAKKEKDIGSLEETLKWGEPSYLAKYGSTIRIDWKAKNPDQYAMYFKCTSKLVPTFKEVFGDVFSFEKDRAIIFNMRDNVPKKELSQCIVVALRYHRVKHLPQLGIQY